ncbi:uncharacterized protein BO66DRAFT_403559 [Aspergillus aculeatinus CBS 121060]|uniref:Uncharacterized protein n=1 Tax=Aspergillus aculeatinus CBS 121060 TaxID=1448322 RepID=A0ACD1H2M5_9EURO|nr:hypothetical protein BO66DRAFT_403559 [Aspergillus aculeatinus CBS 121060]RAH67860.1 hypothetical protein BO66DRAFT_403559 [Aspergillus aculeatinus CBS 121060]
MHLPRQLLHNFPHPRMIGRQAEEGVIALLRVDAQWQRRAVLHLAALRPTPIPRIDADPGAPGEEERPTRAVRLVRHPQLGDDFAALVQRRVRVLLVAPGAEDSDEWVSDEFLHRLLLLLSPFVFYAWLLLLVDEGGAAPNETIQSPRALREGLTHQPRRVPGDQIDHHERAVCQRPEGPPDTLREAEIPDDAGQGVPRVVDLRRHHVRGQGVIEVVGEGLSVAGEAERVAEQPPPEVQGMPGPRYPPLLLLVCLGLQDFLPEGFVVPIVPGLGLRDAFAAVGDRAYFGVWGCGQGSFGGRNCGCPSLYRGSKCTTDPKHLGPEGSRKGIPWSSSVEKSRTSKRGDHDRCDGHERRVGNYLRCFVVAPTVLQAFIEGSGRLHGRDFDTKGWFDQLER